jgi:hypothetical protein
MEHALIPLSPLGVGQAERVAQIPLPLTLEIVGQHSAALATLGYYEHQSVNHHENNTESFDGALAAAAQRARLRRRFR